MKNIATPILLLVLATGCSYNYPYSHSSIGTAAPPVMPASQYSLVNNSGYTLKVYQDGKYTGDASIGQVLPIRGAFLWRNTVVTVTGVDARTNYVGSISWIYQFGVPEAWTVTKLNEPQEPR